VDQTLNVMQFAAGHHEQTHCPRTANLENHQIWNLALK